MFITSLYRGIRPALIACTLVFAASAVFAQAGPVPIPVAPTKLVATTAASKISLSWSKVSGAKSYVIYRSTTSGSGYKLIGTPTDARGTDSHPMGGMTYYYVVTAVNPSGESPQSAQISAATPTPAAAPVAPITVVAIAAGPKINLTWPAVPGADSYIIYRSTTSDNGYKLIGTPIDSRGTDSHVYYGTTYFYTVTAVNIRGEGPKSAPVPAVAPAPVTNPK